MRRESFQRPARWGGEWVSCFGFGIVEGVGGGEGGGVCTFVCGTGDAFHDCFPVEEVGFGDGVEGLEDGGGF